MGQCGRQVTVGGLALCTGISVSIFISQTKSQGGNITAILDLLLPHFPCSPDVGPSYKGQGHLCHAGRQGGNTAWRAGLARL